MNQRARRFTQSQWRLLDTGTRSADENIALDHALLEARAMNLAPNTVRFLRFAPPAVLVGYHQAIENEVRLSFCRKKGIDIQRRITGGGTIYFDPTQIGWEVIARFEDLGFHRVTLDLFRVISECVIAGLKELGLNACFRPRNDIEVNGRKISGTGGTETDGAFLFQGTLLVDFDPHTMVKALRIPVEKLKSHEIDSIKDRVTWINKELFVKPDTEMIKRALTRGFEKTMNVTLQPGALKNREQEIYRKKLDFVRQRKWTHKVIPGPREASYVVTLKKPNGLIKMLIHTDNRSQSIQYVNFLGDFFSTPRDLIHDLEGALKFKELSIPAIESVVKKFFKSTKGRLLGFSVKDFVQLFDQIVNKTVLSKYNMTVADANNMFTLNGTYEDILSRRIRTILLPYCAKGAKCRYRKKQGCIECEECTVSDAYALARQYDLRPITITSFRHLMKTLRVVRNEDCFIGLCCEQFYIRHRKDMEKHGIPGLLLNIKNETCYDLDQVGDAELGNFEHQTDLPTRLLKKVLEINRNV